jgi:hypothetical protein
MIELKSFRNPNSGLKSQHQIGGSVSIKIKIETEGSFWNQELDNTDTLPEKINRLQTAL